MESIKYTPECVQKTEEDDQSALAHRDRVLEHFSTAPGLGPIDLVVCRKAGKGAFNEQQSSFFHQVLGHDLTSTASAAAYFAELCNSIEEVGFIPGLFTSHQWKVTQCVYCCFDAFSRLDVRCHMSVPGGVTAYAVDSKGQRYDMTTAHWKRVSVSAFLRYEYYHPSIFRGIPGVVHRQGVRTPDAEESILDSIVDLYYDRVPPEVLNMLRPGGQRGGALPEDNDPMLAAVLQHFKRRRVLEGAVEFFTQVASLHAPAVVQLCCALEALGRSEDALQVLRSNALRMPQDVNIICALAAAEAATGSQKDALQLARHALMLAPKSTTALLCMARMQAMCGAPALSVLAMHLIVPPSDPSVLIRRIFPCGLPPHERVTSPVHKRWPLEEQEVCILEEEMNFPKRFDQATNWLRVVKQLCGIADDGAHDELPFIPPDVHTDTAILRTSIVRLLPFIQGTQYLVITMCMKEVGMHNFMRILQALSRNATEKAAKEATSADPVKAPPPPVSDKPTQKRRNKRATAAFKPLLARQRSSHEIARDPSWAPSQAVSLDGSSAENAATGPSAAPTDATGSHSISSLPAGLYDASTAGTDAEVPAPVEPSEPAEAVAMEPVAAVTPDTVDTPVEAAAGSARTTSGSVAGVAAAHSPTESSAAEVAGDAEDDVAPPPEVPSQPPAPAVVADLSRVPADLVPGDSRARQQPDPEGHPIAEGCSLEGSNIGDRGGPSRESSLSLSCLLADSQQEVDTSDDSELGLNGCCEGTLSCTQGTCMRSGRAAMGEPLGEGVNPLYKEPLLSDERDRAESPPPLGELGRAMAVGEAPEHLSAVSGTSPDASTAHGKPLQALQDALQRMESGSPGVTAERLGRLQLRAQEHAARVVTSNSLRSRQFKKLQLGGARQRRDGPAATSEGQKDSGGASEDIGPVALKIVDPAKLQLTSEQLLEDAKQRTSVRHTEAMQVLAALLVSTTAPPGAIQEVSMNVAHLVTLVLQDLDDAAHVHSAAVHETSDVNAKGLLAAAEHVQHNCSQFLQFQHHPLGGAALPDASVTEGATVGDWLAWAGACERLGCELHARYAYTKALVFVQPQRCLTANMAVSRLVAGEADIHTVFDHLTEVLLMMDQRRDQVLGTAEVAHGVVKEGQVSSAIIAVLATVIDAWGMNAVQNRLEKGSGQYHPSIDPVVEQAFGWGTDGCDA